MFYNERETIMKKRFAKIITCILLAIMCCVLLASCVENTVNVKMNGEGGGTVVYSYKMKKSVADELWGQDQLYGELKNAKLEEIDGELYYHNSYEYVADTDEDLKSELLGVCVLNESSLPMFKSVIIEDNYICIEIDDILFSEELKESYGVEDMQADSSMIIDLSVKLPSIIAEHTGGKVSFDGRTVSARFDNTSTEYKIEASCIDMDYGLIVFLAIAAVALLLLVAVVAVVVVVAIIAFVVILMLRKVKKSKKAKNAKEEEAKKAEEAEQEEAENDSSEDAQGSE